MFNVWLHFGPMVRRRYLDMNREERAAAREILEYIWEHEGLDNAIRPRRQSIPADNQTLFNYVRVAKEEKETLKTRGRDNGR